METCADAAVVVETVVVPGTTELMVEFEAVVNDVVMLSIAHKENTIRTRHSLLTILVYTAHYCRII